MSAKYLFLVLTLSVFSSPTFFGQQSIEKANLTRVEQDKTAVAHLEQKWLNALNDANVNAISEVLADDFIRPAAESGEFVNKPDLLQFYRSHLSPQNSSQRRIEHMTVTLYGLTALARGVLTTTDSNGLLIRKLLFTDIFVKRAGKWRAVSAQESDVTTAQVPAH